MASITLKNITKTYEDGNTVISDLNLEIKDKEFIILVGPSGCGKSTTLRMIAGLEEVTSGDLLIGDKRVNDDAPKDRDIAMVFQSYALYPHMTVYKNMAFALELRKVNKKEIDRKVREVAKILEIEDYLNRKPEPFREISVSVLHSDVPWFVIRRFSYLTSLCRILTQSFAPR